MKNIIMIVFMLVSLTTFGSTVYVSVEGHSAWLRESIEEVYSELGIEVIFNDIGTSRSGIHFIVKPYTGGVLGVSCGYGLIKMYILGGDLSHIEVRNIVRHELGHEYNLLHVKDDSDVMYYLIESFHDTPFSIEQNISVRSIFHSRKAEMDNILVDEDYILEDYTFPDIVLPNDCVPVRVTREELEMFNYDLE